jgi:phosphoribosylformimino-5-aminoimidazole carboxamide ribotide isomerase
VQIIPVLDVLGGGVVRGVGGRRAEYRPIQSSLTVSAEPAAVLDALIDRFRFRTAYVADLDGVMYGRPDLEMLTELAQRPIALVIDAGVKSAAAAATLWKLEDVGVAAASETLPSVRRLAEITDGASRERLLFSMDLKRGRPLVAADEWEGRTPDEIIDDAVDCGVRRFILLDLADVGEGRGLSTLPLLTRLRGRHPGGWFAVGGGVRSMDDVRAAERAGADAVLIASALHDGRISPACVHP